MAQQDAAIRRRRRASRRTLNLDMETIDDQTEGNGRGAKFQETNEVEYVHPEHETPHSNIHQR